jgi:hypothetical protein
MMADRITRSCVRETAASVTDASLPDGTVMKTKRAINAWATKHPNPCAPRKNGRAPFINPHVDQYRS